MRPALFAIHLLPITLRVIPLRLKFCCISPEKKLSCSIHFIFETGADVAENDTITKEGQEKALDELQREAISRFEASDREEEAFRKEMANMFDRFEATIMKGFDEYDAHTTQAFDQYSRDIISKIDRLTELLLITISSFKK
jgi:hypothetical protein